MNTGNVCANIPVTEVYTPQPYAYMMDLQYELQRRLGKAGAIECTREQALQLIYWRHCIHTECDELMEWFQVSDANPLELEMEVIDILHFVFNLGITLQISPDAVQALLSKFEFTVADALYEEKVALATVALSRSITSLIDHFPWKNWKTYVRLQVDTSATVLSFARIVKATLQLAGTVGMSRDRVVNVYLAKNKENHKRQDRGY